MAHKVQLLLHLEQSNYFIGLLAVVAVESLQVSNRTPNNTDAILHDVKVSMPMTTYGHDFVPAAISRQNLSDTARCRLTRGMMQGHGSVNPASTGKLQRPLSAVFAGANYLKPGIAAMPHIEHHSRTLRRTHLSRTH
jgi:hypothetical protein